MLFIPSIQVCPFAGCENSKLYGGADELWVHDGAGLPQQPSKYLVPDQPDQSVLQGGEGVSLKRRRRWAGGREYSDDLSDESALDEGSEDNDIQRPDQRLRRDSPRIVVISPSLLPQFKLAQGIQTISSSALSISYSTFETYTYYRELTEAATDSELEVALARLIKEWQSVGASVRLSAGHATGF